MSDNSSELFVINVLADQIVADKQQLIAAQAAQLLCEDLYDHHDIPSSQGMLFLVHIEPDRR